MERLTDEYGSLKKCMEITCEKVDGCRSCLYLSDVLERLAKYEFLEEQGMLLKLNAPIEEIIRCAMCTNIMRSDRGCDGGCQVDERLFNKIMEEILKSQLK